MSKHSNWDDDAEDPPSGEKAAARTSGEREFDDGFGQSESHSDSDTADTGVVDVPSAKPGAMPVGKTLMPKILVGLMGLVVLGVLWFFGTGLIDKLSRKPSARPAPQALGPTVPPAPPAPPTQAVEALGKGTVLMGGGGAEQTALSLQAGTTPTGQELAGGPAASAASALPTPVVPATAGATGAALETRIEETNARVLGLQEEVRLLREQVAKQSQTVTVSVESSPKPPRARVRPAVAARKDRNAGVIVEPAEAALPVEISRLRLRGVYPPTGEDRQAWVMDGEKTRTLSKGDKINGATVLRVETDRVVTSAGSIY